MNGSPARDRNMAMVFQNDVSCPHMTVYENTAFVFRVRRIPLGEIDPRVKEEGHFRARVGENLRVFFDMGNFHLLKGSIGVRMND